MNQYFVTTTPDGRPPYRLQINAGSIPGAIQATMEAERCPECSIVAVELIRPKAPINPILDTDDPRIEIYTEALYEDIPIRGHALASGDTETDKQVEGRILAELDAGNEWAWCVARVWVRCKEWDEEEQETHIIEEDEYLGCCSYNNEQEFKEGGYWNDMVDACIDRINARLPQA